MKRLVMIALAVGVAAPAVAQQANVQKAVDCQTLNQQFGDSIKSAEAEDAAKTAASELAQQGLQACMGHDYDAGMDQLRQALQQIGLEPVV